MTKILVAEDSASSRMLLVRELGKWDYEVVEAKDGLEALEKLRDSSINLAIIDWMMPGLDGPSVCEKLQSRGRFIYAILLTGRSEASDLVHALEKGASDYIVKPFDGDYLHARIRVGERMVRLQQQIVQMQKLESMGRLASGVAHEINTPVQFVGDNVNFILETFEELEPLLKAMGAHFGEGSPDTLSPESMAELKAAVSAADIEYIVEEIPTSIRQSIEGVGRIAKIVASMKEFCHPSSEDMEPVDLNAAIETTMTVSRSEWKYIADIETDLDEGLPAVTCYVDAINQSVLNLIVNAAHAIKDSFAGTERRRGLITIKTTYCDSDIEIRIGDNGTGIDEETCARIFEPFFTTKAVGVGTGQGLAQVHSTITEKHSGSVKVESEVGRGTTFVLRFPVKPAQD